MRYRMTKRRAIRHCMRTDHRRYGVRRNYNRNKVVNNNSQGGAAVLIGLILFVWLIITIINSM